MDELLTPDWVAEKLGVSDQALRAWRMRNEGPPYVQVSERVIRYPAAKFVAWLESRCTGCKIEAKEDGDE